MVGSCNGYGSTTKFISFIENQFEFLNFYVFRSSLTSSTFISMADFEYFSWGNQYNKKNSNNHNKLGD